MFQFALSAWRAGLRGRSFHAVFILGLVLIGVAYLAGYFSPRHPRTVALDVGFSGLRFSLVLLNLFWVHELVGKEIDRRTVIFSLSYPIARRSYLVGRFLGVQCLSAAAALVMGSLLWLAVRQAGGQYDQGFPVALGLPYWSTVFGLFVDGAVVGAFALLLSSLSTVALLPLALGAAFAVAGKGLGAVLDYLSRGADGDAAMVATYSPLMGVIQAVLPDLSRLDWRAWPMYALAPDVGQLTASLVMGFGYVVVAVLVASSLFSRREFT